MNDNRKVAKRRNKRQGNSTPKGAPQQEVAEQAVEQGKTPVASKDNDAAWYTQAAALAQNAGRLNFSNVMGMNWGVVDAQGQPVTNGTGTVDNYSIPGVLALPCIPTFGYNDDYNSPLNIASVSSYGFVRYANSGAKNYDHQDLMLYFISAAQVYAYLNFLIRLYGLLNLYVQDNRYYPRALVVANGADFDSLVNHMANFRYGIAQLISKASSFALPAGMTLFERQAWLYTGVYTEGSSTKDQLYMYVPGGFLQFKIDSNSGAGMMEYKPFLVARNQIPNNGYFMQLGITTDGLRDYEELLDYGRELIDAMLSQEDFGIMSGDILKAYGADNILKLVDIPDNYTVIPSYSPEVLYQMKNSTPIFGEFTGNTYTGGSMSFGTFDVYQDVERGILSTSPELTCEGTSAFGPNTNAALARQLQNTLGGSFIITTDKQDGADVDEVFVSSRLAVGIKTSYSSGTITMHFLCGTEMIFDPFIVTVGKDFTLPKGVGITEFGIISGYTNLSSNLLDIICYLSSFKYHPRMVWDSWDSITDKHAQLMFWDFDNYATESVEVLGRIHEAALISMIQTPTIAKLWTTRGYKG